MLVVQLRNGITLPAKQVGHGALIGLPGSKVNGATDLGAEPTVTKGMGSAKNRLINKTIQVSGRPVEVDIRRVIKADAAINQGKSRWATG